MTLLQRDMEGLSIKQSENCGNDHLRWEGKLCFVFIYSQVFATICHGPENVQWDLSEMEYNEQSTSVVPNLFWGHAPPKHF